MTMRTDTFLQALDMQGDVPMRRVADVAAVSGAVVDHDLDGIVVLARRVVAH